MYIHNYQIHNVLNEYRKQLSRFQAPAKKNASAAPEIKDHITLSDTVRRQSIIEKVSSDIVERIKNSNTFQSEAGTVLNRPQEEQGGETSEKMQREKEFTYTLIDEFNRKMTNKLMVRNLKPLAHLPEAIQEKMDQLAMQAPEMEKDPWGSDKNIDRSNARTANGHF